VERRFIHRCGRLAVCLTAVLALIFSAAHPVAAEMSPIAYAGFQQGADEVVRIRVLAAGTRQMPGGREI